MHGPLVEALDGETDEVSSGGRSPDVQASLAEGRRQMDPLRPGEMPSRTILFIGDDAQTRTLSNLRKPPFDARAQ